MKTGVITESQRDVLEYLQDRPGEFVSPTEIGLAHGHNMNCTSWACKRLKRLVEEGLVERNKRGWYRAVQEANP